MPYPFSPELPDLVCRAQGRAAEIGFPLMPEGRPIGWSGPPTAVTPMDGALLRSLAAAHPGGTIAEIGTGAGVGTAWLLSGATRDTRLVSCDIDRHCVDHTRQLFVGYPNVDLVCGDWQVVLPPRGPFDLLFFDANPREILSATNDWDRVVDLLKIGGQIVMDDLVPVELWPDEWRGITDSKREFCLSNPRLAGVDVRTSARTAAVIGTRIA